MTLLLFSGCHTRGTIGDSAAELSRVRFALPAEPMGALVMIAEDQGYFAKRGIELVLDSTEPSGKRALQVLLDGDVDMTICAGVPFLLAACSRDDINILATIASSGNEPRIVARRDRGIASPADLRGKRVGTQEFSAVHYFLDLVATQYGLQDDLQVEFLAAEQLPAALADGSIDAFSMREPFVSEAVAQLGDNAIVFDEPGAYVKMMMLVARSEFLHTKPLAAENFVRALLDALEFALANPEETQQIVADRLGIEPAKLDWTEMHLTLEVELSHALVMSLDHQLQWARENELTHCENPPNVVDYLAPEVLRNVEPRAISLIE